MKVKQMRRNKGERKKDGDIKKIKKEKTKQEEKKDNNNTRIFLPLFIYLFFRHFENAYKKIEIFLKKLKDKNILKKEKTEAKKLEE